MSEATVPKIMIVDDNRATSTLLRTLFEIEGYEGLICPRPEEVLETIAQAQPDLVLMDVHLADVDSISILAEIRVDRVIGSVPVIMTSGMDMKKECLAAGASAFILKPFKPSDLMNLIRQHLAETS